MEIQIDYKNLIFGIRAVIEAINSGKELEVVYVAQNAKGPLMGELRKLLKEKAIPSKQVPTQAFNKYRRDNHQGVMAAISPIQYHQLEGLVPSLYEKGKIPFFLILDHITDVRNFGAICRSASCFGVDAVIIPFKGSAMINEFAVKSSAGALLHLPVCRVKSLEAAVEFLKESGLQIFSCTEKASNDFKKSDYQSPLVIIMGAEDKGITYALLEQSDGRIQIPITGPIESLNVSVASGIILSEVFSQRSNVEQ